MDKVKDSGTLKIRQIMEQNIIGEVKWYDLKPINDELENINYCYEMLDKDYKYKDVDLYLEPGVHESFAVNIWLKSGLYAAKIYFIGEKPEEFWIHTTSFQVD